MKGNHLCLSQSFTLFQRNLQRYFQKLAVVMYGLVIAFLFSWSAWAQNISVDLGEEGHFEPQRLIVPYVFFSESIGFAGGLTFSSQGYFQKQSYLVITGIIGTDETRSTYIAARDIQIPLIPRLFLKPEISAGIFEEINVYIDGNPRFPGVVAGKNDSDKDDFLESKGKDVHYRLTFSYLFPLGHGKNEIINTMVLDRGILYSGETGGKAWNPLKTGRTYFEVKPFYRKQELDTGFKDGVLETNGFEFTLRYDNKDFVDNPSEGSEQRITVARDWGAGSSSNPWTAIDGKVSKYISLGPSDKFRQRVIAINAWTANALTWESSHRKDGKTIFHRPPNYAGATLGGLNRLRAFPANRFSDRAAIYYTVEYRAIPKWNPMGEAKWLKFLEIKWWQFVPFVEVGRVAPKWTLSELHSDMKRDAGLGIRVMAKRLVIRIDSAVSEEGTKVQMFVNHPF